jgi:hypothetical protein
VHCSDRDLTTPWLWSIPGKLFRVIALLVFMPGKIPFALPSFIIRRFLNSKIKNLPFYGPVKWVLGFFGFGLWCAILLGIGYLVMGATGAIIVLAWLFCGFLVLLNFHNTDILTWLAPVRISKDVREKLRSMRTEIMQRI